MNYYKEQIAYSKTIGFHVAATTHRESKLNLLKEAGADECILDTGNLSETYNARFTKALELVGCKTLRDTLWCMAAVIMHTMEDAYINPLLLSGAVVIHSQTAIAFGDRRSFLNQIISLLLL